jgi:hypothetical protein
LETGLPPDYFRDATSGRLFQKEIKIAASFPKKNSAVKFSIRFDCKKYFRAPPSNA